jgi:hypothetical protein
MSTSAITGSLFSQIASSPSAANQFATDLDQLAQDVQSGNLSAAQQDYVTLSQDALNGVTSSSATTSANGITTSLLSDVASSPSSSSSFVNELNLLGSDLSNGDLASAQGDMLSLDFTAFGAAPSSSAAASSTTSQGDISALISATMEAIKAGDDPVIGSDMSQLASVSTSSAGASYLASDSQGYGSGSSSTLSQGSLSQMLQGLNTDNSSGSDSPLSLLA